MAVKKGYKQTEVGVLPADWEIVSFGEVFDFLTTATYSRDQLSDNGVAYYVHYGDIHTKWNHFLDLNQHTLPAISKEQLKNYHLLKDGDLIMADASEDYDGVGKCVEVKNVGLKKAISGLHTFLLRDKSSQFVSGFKGYIHSNNLVKRQFDKLATGLKVYGVSRSNLKIVLIPLPPTKVEQTAIAAALSDANALIQSLEKLIAKKRLIKQGAMQKLLKPKEGWVVKKLGEIISFVVDNRGKTPPLVKTGHPLIEVNAIYKQGKSPNYSVAGKFVDQMTYDSWFRDGHPQIGDVLVVTVGTAGSTCFVTESIGCIAQNIIALRLHKTFSSECFYYLTLTNLFQDQVRAVLMGAVQPSLKVPHLREFSLPFPSLPEQTRIATILSDMDAEIAALETKLSKYKLIKQGMMQNLLTGKIRLV